MPTVKNPSPPAVRDAAEPGLRSKVTAKAQTTLPSGVRKALGVSAGDELEYEILGDHAIVRRASPAGPDPEDPALLGFLDLLERDISGHSERAQAVPPALYARMQALAHGIGRTRHDPEPFDPDAPIDGSVAL